MDTLLDTPETSRRGAAIIQKLDTKERYEFLDAMAKAHTIEELPEPFAGWMRHGYSKKA